MELIETCLNFNLFEYNQEWYKQVFGLAMGSPLSPVIACLYMEHLEKEKILPSLPEETVWVRYVDDVLVFTDSVQAAETILQGINNIENSIKFSMELEKNGQLPFLDVNIIKKHNRISFDVYRKCTNREAYVHYLSSHSEKTKTGIVIGFFLRAFRICDPEYLENEITRIYDAFTRIKYPRQFIYSAWQKAKRIYYRPRDDVPNNIKRVTLPTSTPHTENISMLIRSKYETVQRYSNTIGRNLRKFPGRTAVNEGGVYTIPCESCPKVYVGETGKALHTRIKQHKAAYQRMDTNNAMFVHAWENNHVIDWENAKISVKCQDLRKRRLLETTKIKFTNNYNLRPDTLDLEIETLNLINNIYKLDKPS